MIPVSSETKRIPERKGSLANYDLLFQVSLPALGFSSYFVKMSNSMFSYFDTQPLSSYRVNKDSKLTS